MSKYAFIFLLAIGLLVGCNDDSAVSEKQEIEQQIKEEGFSEPKEEVVQSEYKRYVGTIAGQTVVANLVFTENRFEGDYYYKKIGVGISLYTLKDTGNAEDEYTLVEYPPEKKEHNANWYITQKGDSLIGIWEDNKAGKSYDILLAENYPDDVQRFSIISMADSIRLIDSLPNPKANASYQVLLPLGNDESSQYTKKAIKHIMGCDSLGVANMHDCMQASMDAFLTEYRNVHEGDVAEEDIESSMFRWDNSEDMSVMYNENNIVVIAFNGYVYTGGAHGNYGVGYTTIDRKLQQVWKLEDIMSVDSTYVVGLIAGEIRQLYGLGPSEPLNNVLFSGDLHVPNNYYINSRGVTFSYSLYEIASYADGIIEVLIPYEKIMHLLNPKFKQRMGLEGVAK